MRFYPLSRKLRFTPKPATIRGIVGLILMVTLASCTTQAALEAEMAAQEATRVMQEQTAAAVAQAEERERAAELQRRREQQVAERARLQAQRDRQAAAAQARADEERRQREEAERVENERLAVIAAAQAQRQAKLNRISALEAQIASIQDEVSNDDASASFIEEAIVVAEELLDALAAEQAKYEDTDASGNTVQPLSKDLIADLEARKDNLVRQASSQ